MDRFAGSDCTEVGAGADCTEGVDAAGFGAGMAWEKFACPAVSRINTKALLIEKSEPVTQTGT
jgi:hypothetical protein